MYILINSFVLLQVMIDDHQQNDQVLPTALHVSETG